MKWIKNASLIALLFLWMSHIYGQYEGGDGDGSDPGLAIQIDLTGQPFGVNSLYYGGKGDGHDQSQTASWMNGSPSSAVYQGGNGDGQDANLVSSYLSGLNVEALYSGGKGDGQDTDWKQLFLNNQSSSALYSGGEGDGHDNSSVQLFISGELIDILYGGGNGDGQDRAMIQTYLAGVDLAALYSGGDGDGHDKAEHLGSAIPFPVSLLTFEAYPENEYVIVQWITEAELNNDFFTVEKSLNAEDFEMMEKVKGAGTTNSINEYQIIDPEPFIGKSFYRLKSTDFDGAFAYSQIVEVNLKAPAAWKLLVFPNPNSGEHINLKLSGLDREKEIHAEIIDMQGRIVWQDDYKNNTSVFETTVDLNRRLSKGSYLVKIRSGAEQISKLILVF